MLDNMKIGLIDVDGGKFPNLALMKISAYLKAKGEKYERQTLIYDNRYDYKQIYDGYAI